MQTSCRCPVHRGQGHNFRSLNDLRGLRKKDLRDRLEAEGLPTDGINAELTARLVMHRLGLSKPKAFNRCVELIKSRPTKPGLQAIAEEHDIEVAGAQWLDILKYILLHEYGDQEEYDVG